MRWKCGQSYPLLNGLSMLTTWLPAALPICLQQLQVGNKVRLCKQENTYHLKEEVALLVSVILMELIS